MSLFNFLKKHPKEKQAGIPEPIKKADHLLDEHQPSALYSKIIADLFSDDDERDKDKTNSDQESESIAVSQNNSDPKNEEEAVSPSGSAFTKATLQFVSNVQENIFMPEDDSLEETNDCREDDVLNDSISNAEIILLEETPGAEENPKQSESFSDISSIENRIKTAREFDLNIEKILENWEVYHAIREIIANALDETILRNAKPIQIFEENGWWNIADYGSGLNYHHLTQNENEEKLLNDGLIGRFGVGLKDALATLYRHNISVEIESKYGHITLGEASKTDFEDIITLHAVISPPKDENMIGTIFRLYGCSSDDILKAKSLFLEFNNETTLEKTKYGSIIQKNGAHANIYINGVKVAEEPNFLFSYNITSLNAQLKKALNRERTNVGRTAYGDRVKSIIISCQNSIVWDLLIEDYQNFSTGSRHDEIAWTEIAFHITKEIQNRKPKTTFITTTQIQEAPDIYDRMKRLGAEPVVVPDSLVRKIEQHNEIVPEEKVIKTMEVFKQEERDAFVPTVIDPNQFSKNERKVYDMMDDILALIGGKPERVRNIKIVDKVYEDSFDSNTVGCWTGSNILIRRDQLKFPFLFAGTLLHECAHAASGKGDVDRDFEKTLTFYLGLTATRIYGKE